MVVHTKSPPTLPDPAEDLRSSLASRRLTCRAIWRIRRRTIGWISQVIVLLLLKVFSAFHVPAFQRIHRKRLAPFFWNALRVQLVLSPLFAHANSTVHSRSLLCAKQASLMGCVGLRSPTRPLRRNDRNSRHGRST